MYLPENIRTVRKAWRESMEVFSERFGLSRFAMGKYESGDNEPSASFLAKLCELTGLSALSLVNRKLEAHEIPRGPLEPGMPLDVLNDSEGVDSVRVEPAGQKGNDALVLEMLLKLQKTLEAHGERLVALENKVLNLERPF